MDIAQGSENAGKALIVGEDGNVTVSSASASDRIPITSIADLNAQDWQIGDMFIGSSIQSTQNTNTEAKLFCFIFCGNERVNNLSEMTGNVNTFVYDPRSYNYVVGYMKRDSYNRWELGIKTDRGEIVSMDFIDAYTITFTNVYRVKF